VAVSLGTGTQTGVADGDGTGAATGDGAGLIVTGADRLIVAGFFAEGFFFACPGFFFAWLGFCAVTGGWFGTTAAAGAAAGGPSAGTELGWDAGAGLSGWGLALRDGIGDRLKGAGYGDGLDGIGGWVIWSGPTAWEDDADGVREPMTLIPTVPPAMVRMARVPAIHSFGVPGMDREKAAGEGEGSRAWRMTRP